MIKLSGITVRQSQLLVILWEIPSLVEVDHWISTLEPDDARDATILTQLLIYEYVDQQLNDNSDYSQAKEILSRF